MKLFRDYVMSWWEVGLLKLYVMVIGLLVGSYFADVVREYYTVLFTIFVILAVYFMYKLFTNGFALKEEGMNV